MATQTEIKTVQMLLNQLGEDLVEDGIIGAKTTSAIKQFQLENNILPDGRITSELIQSLNMKVSSGDVTESSPSFVSKISDFVSTNKKPIIILGSLTIFAGGIWFLKSRLTKKSI